MECRGKAIIIRLTCRSNKVDGDDAPLRVGTRLATFNFNNTIFMLKDKTIFSSLIVKITKKNLSKNRKKTLKQSYKNYAEDNQVFLLCIRKRKNQ